MAVSSIHRAQVDSLPTPPTSPPHLSESTNLPCTTPAPIHRDLAGSTAHSEFHVGEAATHRRLRHDLTWILRTLRRLVRALLRFALPFSGRSLESGHDMILATIQWSTTSTILRSTSNGATWGFTLLGGGGLGHKSDSLVSGPWQLHAVS